MSERVSCVAWDPGDCEGTAACPPRCPRVVLDDGTAVLVEPRDRPLSVALAAGLSAPDAPSVPGELLLVATRDGEAVGYAHLLPEEGGSRRATVAVAPEAPAELRAELARQAVAYAAREGAERLVVDDVADPAAYEAVGFEPAGEDGRVALSLSDPAVATLTTPPARSSDAATGSGAVATGENDPATGQGDGRRSDDGDPATAPLPSPDEGADLSPLLAPDRVAVVGATDREGSIGRLLMENLDDYAGEVVPVTPRADEVFGRSAPSGLDDVDGAVDLAVVALPPEPAVEAVEAAGRRGVGAVAVVSAGFGETEGGDERAERLRAAAEEHDLTLLGPNSMGAMSTASGLDASFSPRHPSRGVVSLVSQSGAFITAALDAATGRGLGFRNVLSVGNKAVLDGADVLRYLDRDPGTEVIAAYLEDVADGERFVDVAREVTRSTPVVVLKSGRTEAGAAAAASHTGSLAGSETAIEVALDRAGVVRVDSSEALLDAAAALRGPLPDGDGVGVVTNAGGPGVLATDAVAEEGLAVADFADETRDRLDGTLPGGAAVENPVDVLGDADAGRFAAAIDAVLADPGVDVGLVVTTPHPLIDYADLIAAVGRRSLARDTPAVLCLMGDALDADARRALTRYGVPAYDDPSRAAAAVAAAREHARVRDRPAVGAPDPGVDLDRVRDVVGAAREEGRSRLGVASMDLLEACGIDVPEWGLAATPAEAAAVASGIGGEVVLKVASPDVAHKADVGGVRVGVAPGAAAEECERLLADVREARPAATIDGVVVQAAVDLEDGTEVMAGATGSRFGPLVTVGLGGIFVEQLEDVAFDLAPVDHERALGLLDSLDAADVLRGARDRPPVDREAVADALVRLSVLAAGVPAIASLDVNPLLATPDGATALDLQVELADDGE